MNYKSTRDVKVNVPSAYAISQGLSSDGGLFVPENLPKLSEEKIMSLCDMSYAERAYEIFRLFLTDFTDDEIKHCVNGAYNDKNFATDNIAEISHLFPGTYMSCGTVPPVHSRIWHFRFFLICSQLPQRRQLTVRRFLSSLLQAVIPVKRLLKASRTLTAHQ